MADLATCYFCGRVEGEIEEHPVIPETLDPPDERQRTVAICPDCRRKFDRAVQPLVAFLAESDSPVADSSPSTIEEGPEDEGSQTTESARRDVDSEEGDGDRDESSEQDDLPDASRDVLRLLRNREFPVDREDIEAVAESAYELGPRESREAIDALVERGILVEDEGRLDRPG